MSRVKWYGVIKVAGAILMVAGAGQAQTGDSVLKVFLDRMVERIDADGDGRIAKAEFDKARLTHFAAADGNDDALISQSEFVRLGLAEVGPMSRPWLGPIFAALDRNVDQRLTRREVETAADEMFARADRNGDGVVAPSEIRPGMAMAR